MNGARWRKSTYSSGNGGSCVEVADNLPGVVGVRDTKDRGIGPVLTFTDMQWQAFVVGVRRGAFDLPR